MLSFRLQNLLRVIFSLFYYLESIDVKVNDYPRELDSKRQKLENYEKALNLIKMKDELICKLLSQMEINEDKLIEEFKERTHNEISEWVK